MATITLDPATRLEGHLKVSVETNAGKVTTAKSSGMMFRGFENLLAGKDPRDAAHITQRVCGVCPISHGMAACLAGESGAGMAVPDNARLVRNLILGANFLQSHVLHFYTLALLSYIKGPDMPPWSPAYGVDMRFNAAENQRLLEHYLQALIMRRKAHEMASVFSGHMPHTVVFEFGGVTTVPKAADVSRFRIYLTEITSFIDRIYMADVDLLAQRYSDYYTIGRGYGHLLAFGVFDLNAAGSSKLMARGRIANGATTISPVNLAAITEQAKYSWYDDAATGRQPSEGITVPSPDKAGAYSWLKAPRYGGVAHETGPLARMWVNGDYRRGISVMDRHQARVHEASKIAHAMDGWLSQIILSAPFYAQYTIPANATAFGLTEAPRGALGHWVKISNRAISSYQILTPTCWNCSPRDASGSPGPLEKALEGVAVSDAAKPIEVLRVVQSYDPCLSCAVH